MAAGSKPDTFRGKPELAESEKMATKRFDTAPIKPEYFPIPAADGRLLDGITGRVGAR
jgi:hypothetical protein